ncbi:GLUG motif-containing protein [Methanimicrococcus blatticola]|uniref:GLUG motif-containing protein n=1 Tax=Methanimicrococcus blatticola TaxID=91560 RepID=A0A484F276_9EURY|nr:GLUG motif-containing protein [Methanimicrococcus blatticola]MBZ3936388.1 hypothetical protein [Methanimicrococcus blatticola]MCC2509550.1 hypothetical protein [Methanimicrococcus blatticola]TDQ67602.1 GLUG motif-containing protein [Methanimicrococcus blatticola]
MNYKPICLLIMILTLLLLLTGAAAATPVNKIYDLNDLKNIGNTDYKDEWTMDANYILMKNISISDGIWNSIGNQSHPFKGSFNGNGKTITFTEDVVFNSDSGGYGLFAKTSGNAKLENISLIVEGNLTIEDEEGNDNFGVLVGYCANSGQITISKCSLNLDEECFMKGNRNVGGLIGRFDRGTVENCVVVGDIETTNSAAGGLIGFMNLSDGNVLVQNCSAFGSVATDKYGAGGLIGIVKVVSDQINSDQIKIENCYASVTTESKADGGTSGGLIGELWAGSVNNCYATGNVTANIGFSGGLIGQVVNNVRTDMKVTNCYATGTVIGLKKGGLVGKISESGWYIDDSFYLSEEPEEGDFNDLGNAVSIEQLKSIDAFTVKKEDDGFIEGDGWSISSSYDPEKTWFILEGRDYPKLSWQYKAPSNGGSGTGQAVVINSTDEIPDLTDNTIHDSSEIPSLSEEDDDVSKSGYDVEDNTGPDWKLYLIIGIGLIVVISGVAYFLNKRNGA